MERPTLNDQKEYKIIKQIYFEKDVAYTDDDNEERFERQDTKNRNKTNQAR